jgi:hypothetical protein
MGTVLPSKAVDKIVFCENHNSVWSTNATAIGTTSGEVAALVTKTTAARAAFNAQQLAQEQARTATSAFNDAVASMAGAASDIIKQIKTKAAIVGGNSVYDLALIPPPAPPSPIPAPGTPFDFVAGLKPDGSLELKWKCNNPAGSQGTTYQVYRKHNGESEFTFIGATGTKSFLDDTVPSSGSPITYQVRALRSTVSGTAAQFIVNFGVSGGGTMTASVVAEPRIAA